MRTVTVTWDPKDERFTAVGSHVDHPVDINAPHPPGVDHGATGFSPAELLLASIGSCSAWDVVGILEKGRHPVEGVEAIVTGEQHTESPYAYHTIAVHFVVRGAVRESAVERAVRLSCERYCSVIATVRPTATVTSSFEIV
ncbi:MAG: OsmC family protein [Candidatus Limnocylindrales bacterium]